MLVEGALARRGGPRRAEAMEGGGRREDMLDGRGGGGIEFWGAFRASFAGGKEGGGIDLEFDEGFDGATAVDGWKVGGLDIV